MDEVPWDVLTQQPEFKRREEEIRRAHKMLDNLGAPAKRGIGSVRERIGALLSDYDRTQTIPSRRDIIRSQSNAD